MADEPETEAPQSIERKLATILSADVAGYSRLMAEDEEGTVRAFRGHKQIFQQLVALHRGRIFNTAGDAILAEFGSTVEAVRCATEIQAALRTRNDQLPPARQVAFRIGINLGDVMLQGSDLLGDGVNVAARLQAAAEPGGVCVSGSVYDQIRNKLSLSFKSLGEQSFKNIPQPVRTFSITEVEGHGALPPPKSRGQAGSGGTAKYLVAAVLLLLAAGGGYWAYAQNEAAKAEHARMVAEAEAAREAAAQREAQLVAEKQAAEAAKQEAARREAQLVAEKQAIEEAQRQADAERQAAAAAQRDAQAKAEREAAAQALRRAEAEQQRLAAEKRAAELARQQAEAERKRAEDEARRLADEARKAAEATRLAAAQAAQSQQASIAPAAPSAAGRAGGEEIYFGPICYGPSPNDPARCFRAQAIVSQGRITGKWPGRDPGVTMTLAGDVSAAGEVKIQMHADDAVGARLATINLSGTLKDGRLDANGSFVNGRIVSLNWRHN